MGIWLIFGLIMIEYCKVILIVMVGFVLIGIEISLFVVVFFIINIINFGVVVVDVVFSLCIV